nr:hypothetical protein [Tanacetum cinerariifolium]
MYDEVQAKINADHELAVRLTHKEQEKYIVKERFTHAQLKRSEDDEKRIGNRKKRAASSSIKQKSPKKHKVNDQESKDSDKEHRKCLKVVPDDDIAIDYKTLDVKSLIVNCESQVLGTNKVGDVHVYKLTRLVGSYKHFLTFSGMLEGGLKTLVKPSEDDEIWRNQQDWKLLSWKLLKKSKVFGYILLKIMKLILKKLDFHQDSSNIAKTQSKATLNEPTPQGEGHTVGSWEDEMEHESVLTNPVPQAHYDSPLSGDEDANTEMIIEDKGNGEKGGSIKETISTARPNISAARPEVSTAEPKTPPTTTTLFVDKDVTGKGYDQNGTNLSKTKQKREA